MVGRTIGFVTVVVVLAVFVVGEVIVGRFGLIRSKAPLVGDTIEALGFLFKLSNFLIATSTGKFRSSLSLADFTESRSDSKGSLENATDDEIESALCPPVSSSSFSISKQLLSFKFF